MTPPQSEPLSLNEVKAHLRVDFNDDDAYITALISVARDYAEGFQKKCLAPYTLESIQDYFTDPIVLDKGPVKTVTSVKYIRKDGTEVTIPSTDYLVTIDGKIVPKDFWPLEYLQTVDAVRVTYTAGETTLNPTTKQAMLLLIGNWYEFREPVIVGKTVANVPFSAKQLLWMGKEG